MTYLFFEKKMKKAPVVITKNLDDSFKRNPIIHLESIKEDR